MSQRISALPFHSSDSGNQAVSTLFAARSQGFGDGRPTFMSLKRVIFSADADAYLIIHRVGTTDAPRELFAIRLNAESPPADLNYLERLDSTKRGSEVDTNGYFTYTVTCAGNWTLTAWIHD